VRLMRLLFSAWKSDIAQSPSSMLDAVCIQRVHTAIPMTAFPMTVIPKDCRDTGQPAEGRHV